MGNLGAFIMLHSPYLLIITLIFDVRSCIDVMTFAKSNPFPRNVGPISPSRPAGTVWISSHCCNFTSKTWRVTAADEGTEQIDSHISRRFIYRPRQTRGRETQVLESNLSLFIASTKFVEVQRIRTQCHNFKCGIQFIRLLV